MSPHTTRIVGPREVQPIFITKAVQLHWALVHIRRTPLHADTVTIFLAAVAKTGMLGVSHGVRRRLDTRELPPRGWEVNSSGAGFYNPLPRQRPRLLFPKVLHFSRKGPPRGSHGIPLLIGH
ncbi:hypothetical protein TcG_05358 [Trypanosoma cruzi]|nr:hypothetical protein TcG_05358 [Trypanosoma cruzi]